MGVAGATHVDVLVTHDLFVGDAEEMLYSLYTLGSCVLIALMN
jgi:hypothetical protein